MHLAIERPPTPESNIPIALEQIGFLSVIENGCSWPEAFLAMIF
jgi:hypothetical protein